MQKSPVEKMKFVIQLNTPTQPAGPITVKRNLLIEESHTGTHPNFV